MADDSGRVVSVAPAAGAERFVNTSERQFLDSLHRLDEAWRTRGVLSEDAARQQAHQLRSEIEAVDPAAFNDPENWWALVIEQLEQALL
ncbi:MAG TPA: SUKH-4 family immunity protein [Solirubrobacteraceae bacterium]|nr:SUKH-4 family immunity protein [Solirubrobacteraceae bacterium]